MGSDDGEGGGEVPIAVYGDVYFLVNFSIDFLVLLLVGKFLRLRRIAWRLVLASLLGGAYAVFALLMAFSGWHGVILQFAAAVLLCLIAYGFCGAYDLLRLLCSFYGASVLLGGAVNALYSLLYDIFGASGGSVVTSAKKSEIFMLFALISGVLIYLAGRLFSRRSGVRSVCAEVEGDGRRVTFTGLVDSGNLLTDPLSGRAVIVVKKETVAPLLPRGAMGMLTGNAESIPLGERRRLRVIVAHGIGGGRAMLGYLPDAVLLYTQANPKSKHAVDAILAVADGGEKDFSGHAAIIPAALVG